MNNAEMKKMLVKASVFTVVSIAVMLHRSATKHILITDAAGQNLDREFSSESYNLLVDRNTSGRQVGKLTIPLSKSVSSDDIVMEDRYVDHELRIYIDCREEGFYLDNAVISDLDIIDEAVCITENDTGSVCLDFKIDGLYANESSLTESSTIEVRFFKPYEEYDQIVVVDPVCGGSDAGVSFDTLSEKDIALDVALALRSEVEKSENNTIKFYYTRLSDNDVDDTKRLQLIEDTQADLVVRIGAGLSQDGQDGIRAYYNDEFFLRKLNNAQLAGELVSGCVAKSGTNVVGVYPEYEDDAVLAASKTPAARISVGELNVEEDQNRLRDKAYIGKMASGIYQGISDAFEEMK
jgi:N-acetylmuramoyl-L-alanine amidase